MDKLPPIYADDGAEHAPNNPATPTPDPVEVVEVSAAPSVAPSSPEPAYPVVEEIRQNWQPILVTVGILNFMGLCLVAFKLFTMSYYDIKDAPIIYYAKTNDIIAYSADKPEPRKAHEELVARLKANNALVLNADSVLVASPDFAFPLIGPATGDK
ncbi:hypothetical protein ACTG23_00765 [Aeromonas enteropelogenes]|uniref:hypothetical protein n=1 Tax=Aeromonas TaxID=642 RepID=UPI0039F650B2